MFLWSSELNIKVGLFTWSEHGKPNWEGKIKAARESTAELGDRTLAGTRRLAD